MIKADASDYTKHLPWQVGGVRGKIISGKRQYDYHGIGPDGIEIAAVWFDTRTGAGLKDAHSIVHAVNNIERLEAQIVSLRAGLEEVCKPLGNEPLPGDRGYSDISAVKYWRHIAVRARTVARSALSHTGADQ